MSTTHRDVYMNRKQRVIFFSGARDIRVIAARRFGKTDGTMAPWINRVLQSMARGAGIWAGNSRKQLFTRTVPATIAAIERFWGMKEGEHFWWGQPPKKLNIPTPIIKPKDWSHCISFYNGFVWHLVSLAVTGSANSMTVNAIAIDEARFCSKAKIDAELMPTLSGITHPIGDPGFSTQNPYYKSTLFVSDAALSNRENWMEKEEDKCDIVLDSGEFKGRTSRQLQAELDNYACDVIFFNDLLDHAKKTKHNVMVCSPDKRTEIAAIAECCINRVGAFKVLPNPGINKQNVDILVNYNLISSADAELLFNYEYLITPEERLKMNMIMKSDKYCKRINDLRRNTFAFYRASTIDNVNLLGTDYIEKMKRDLPPIVFAISILNMKKRSCGDGFYAKLDIENLHGYTPQDCPAVEMSMRRKIASRVVGGQTINTDYETPDFDELQRAKTNCNYDGDVVNELPLHIAFDYNANINWVVTGQVYKDPEVGKDSLMVLSSMFTKNERKLRELCRDWCRYYAPHKAHNRNVTFYYDTTAKYGAYALEGMQDFKDVVIEELTREGWEVNSIDMGRPALHEAKFQDINESLAGIAYPFIRFNKENNEALITAMENTGVMSGYKGFQKDKSKEKYVETECDPLELRTDGTDAFDVLFMGVKYFQYSMDGVCLPLRG